MQQLDLSPLPCVDSAENPRLRENVAPGFVDDSVVLALLSGFAENRTPQDVEWLALAADQMDYAGWPPSVSSDKRFNRLT